MAHADGPVNSGHLCPLCEKGDHEWKYGRYWLHGELFEEWVCHCTGCGEERSRRIPHTDYCVECSRGDHNVVEQHDEESGLFRYWCNCRGCDYAEVRIRGIGTGGSRRLR